MSGPEVVEQEKFLTFEVKYRIQSLDEKMS